MGSCCAVCGPNKFLRRILFQFTAWQSSGGSCYHCQTELTSSSQNTHNARAALSGPPILISIANNLKFLFAKCPSILSIRLITIIINVSCFEWEITFCCNSTRSFFACCGHLWLICLDWTHVAHEYSDGWDGAICMLINRL